MEATTRKQETATAATTTHVEEESARSGGEEKTKVNDWCLSNREISLDSRYIKTKI